MRIPVHDVARRLFGCIAHDSAMPLIPKMTRTRQDFIVSDVTACSSVAILAHLARGSCITPLHIQKRVECEAHTRENEREPDTEIHSARTLHA